MKASIRIGSLVIHTSVSVNEALPAKTARQVMLFGVKLSSIHAVLFSFLVVSVALISDVIYRQIALVAEYL